MQPPRLGDDIEFVFKAKSVLTARVLRERIKRTDDGLPRRALCLGKP